MSEPLPPNPLRARAAQIDALSDGQTFDMVVIGGGATGLGTALDAATRGFRVALCEKYDFGKGTSSRSTKLIHGGVRYLEQGNLSLVRESLYERGLLLKNAPQLVHPLATIVPLYSRLEVPYYWAGLKAYDLLAGGLGVGRSKYLSPAATQQAVPTIKRAGLQGGIQYYDAAFDDTRLLVGLLQTAIDEGAVCVNYLPVTRLEKTARRVRGVVARDTLSGNEIELAARVVINGTGPFSDAIRQMDAADVTPRIQPSQGAHVVLDRRFLPGDAAIIVPKTSDGRVIFAIPWNERTLVGTTDTPLDASPDEPIPLKNEVDFLLETVSRYLEQPPTLGDVRAMFAGVRPLVSEGETQETSKLARDHVIEVDPCGLISVMGGKWTTYRRMAQDAVDRAIEVGGLPKLACGTESRAIEATHPASIAKLANDDPSLAEPLDAALPYSAAEAVWAIRNEMAMTVEDVLSRRTRCLLLDAAAAVRAAPRVAELLASEHGHQADWVDDQLRTFQRLARGYLPTVPHPEEPQQEH